MRLSALALELDIPHAQLQTIVQRLADKGYLNIDPPGELGALVRLTLPSWLGAYVGLLDIVFPS